MLFLMARKEPSQVSILEWRKHHGRGGPREGAGRPRTRKHVSYRGTRPKFKKRVPIHLTLRIRDDFPSLRGKRFMAEVRPSLRAACERDGFRLLHYSFQRDHVHMIVEADNEGALGRGMKSIGARIARAANRVFETKGRVFSGSYHTHFLNSPREVFYAIRYVLLNVRKHELQRHGVLPREVWLDAASSARWFDGFSRQVPADRSGSRKF